jgi:hypothetical protein
MKQNIFLTVILLFILGCGAQNSPKEIIEDGIGQDNAMINESLLPQIITIKFPKLIEESLTLSLKENIKHVKNISNILEKNLKFLEKIMPKIIDECQEKNICHFQKNYFTLEENISIGEIDFIKYEPIEPYQYEIVLKLTEIESLTYQWSEIKKDVISTYSNQNETLALHYFNDSNNSEALYINDTRSNEKNTFIISLEQILSYTYHLRYNHIEEEHQNVSSNIIIEDNILVENTGNKNIISNSFTTNDSQTIFSNLKHGDYLLLPPNTRVKTLNFIDILALSEGSFTIFNGAVQGFLYADDFSNNLEDLTIFQLPKKASYLSSI